MAVQFPQRPQGVFDVLQFLGRLAVGIAVLVLAAPDVENHQLRDAEAAARLSGNLPPAPDEPFRHEAVGFRPTRRGVVPAEVAVPAADCDDGLTSGFVESVGRGSVGQGAGSRPWNPVSLPDRKGSGTAPPTTGR